MAENTAKADEKLKTSSEVDGKDEKAHKQHDAAVKEGKESGLEVTSETDTTFANVPYAERVKEETTGDTPFTVDRAQHYSNTDTRIVTRTKRADEVPGEDVTDLRTE